MSLSRLTLWSFRRRRLVVALWIVALIGISVLSAVGGADSRDNFALPGTSSQRAYELLGERFPKDAGDSAQVVLKSADVTDAASKSAFEKLLSTLGSLDHVTAVDSPYADDQHRISDDRKIAYADVHFDTRAAEVPVSTAKKLISEVKAANADSLQFEATGGPLEKAEQPAFGTAEIIGLLAAIVILLFAFGSLLAMGLPIVTALFGIGIGISLIALIGHLLDVPSFAPQVASMIGIGVGIDYALLIVTRFRDGLHRGSDPEQALKVAASTAGRAVMFAGTVVVISLLGLLLMNFAIIRGVAISASAAVLVTMFASITLLPALLGFAGHNIDRFRIPGRHRVTDGERSLSYRWSRVVQHRPWPAALLGALVLIVLALPLAGMRLGSADQGNNPEEFTSRRAYDLLADGFGPGFNGPILVVADLAGARDPNVTDQLVKIFNQTDGVAQAFLAARNDAGDAAIITVIPKTAPQDKATDELVKRLRNEVVPGVVAGNGAQVYVGGITASFIDFASKIASRLPIFIGGVIVLSFLLLMVVFRSLLVPLKAAIMNLLSIGAAYGVIVAVFQWGWLGSLFGVDRTGPIESWVPMMMFAVLFGLSMDYEVFLLSRIREEYLRTGNNAIAVADGLARTARVITAAAAIMIAVFFSFVLGDIRVLKLLGLGLSTAVLVDATIVRMVLVPATMELLGDANWWLPRVLQRRLPHFEVEHEVEEELASSSN